MAVKKNNANQTQFFGEYEKEMMRDDKPWQKKKSRKKSINLNLFGKPNSEEANVGLVHVPTTFDSIEEERILNWKVKKETDSVPFSYKKNNDESNEDITTIDADFADKNLTFYDQAKVANANLCAATGTGSAKAGCAILSGAILATHRDEVDNAATMIQATQEALIAMKPADIFEGMLCSRLWVLHNKAMDCMGQFSNTDAQPQVQEMLMNQATKMMRLHNETLEALNKHRRKGEQKMVVVHQNVQVNDGGQALVTGKLAQGVGGKDKKPKE